MAVKSLPRVTVGKSEYVERVARVIGEAFAQDALNRAAILSKDSLPNDAVISSERRFQHFLPGVQKKLAIGALLVEAGDWAAAALWVPPHVKPPPPDLSSLSPPLVEYFQKFALAKKRHLGSREYWYLNLLGRHPDRTESGVIRALFEPYLQKAQEAGLPMWLEATNEHAREVYKHFGFKIVEEVVIGEGSLDRKGNLVPGGQGIVIYGMIAEPRI